MLADVVRDWDSRTVSHAERVAVNAAFKALRGDGEPGVNEILSEGIRTIGDLVVENSSDEVGPYGDTMRAFEDLRGGSTADLSVDLAADSAVDDDLGAGRWGYPNQPLVDVLERIEKAIAGLPAHFVGEPVVVKSVPTESLFHGDLTRSIQHRARFLLGGIEVEVTLAEADGFRSLAVTGGGLKARVEAGDPDER
ncbi:hypothetical protein [Rhodococcus jostii]|uniref:hypothetical protein n=1 Tax=Rhodococcus jostii TaxID=132919 RepID=UPI00365DC82F